MGWNKLTEQAQSKVAYEWLQCEGYDSLGAEHATPEDYYNATRLPQAHTSNDESMTGAVERGEMTGTN